MQAPAHAKPAFRMQGAEHVFPQSATHCVSAVTLHVERAPSETEQAVHGEHTVDPVELAYVLPATQDVHTDVPLVSAL